MNLGKEILKRSNKTIYLSDDEKFLIKVFDHTLVPKSDVLQEAVIQSRVEELNTILIPSVEEVYKEGSSWAIASTFIKGKTLETLLIEDPNKTKEYIERFVQLQIKMHKTQAFKLQSINALLDERIDMDKNYISASSRYELHVRLSTLGKDDKLVHFDFVPSNIVVTDDDKWYVLDWAHARKGRVEADVSLTYLNFVLENKKDLAELYLKNYIKKADIAKQDVFSYLPLIATYKLSRGGLNQEQINYLVNLTNVADLQ